MLRMIERREDDRIPNLSRLHAVTSNYISIAHFSEVIMVLKTSMTTFTYGRQDVVKEVRRRIFKFNTQVNIIIHQSVFWFGFWNTGSLPA